MVILKQKKNVRKFRWKNAEIFSRNDENFVNIQTKFVADFAAAANLVDTEQKERSIRSEKLVRKILFRFFSQSRLSSSLVDVFIRTRTAWFSLIQGTAHHI